MENLRKEVEANFAKFSAVWKSELKTITGTLDKEDAKFSTSYGRLISMQAWRTELLENVIDKDSLGFFAEAQNDVLVSHVFARMGAWRSALKSLRSCIDNVCYCLYYKDHPVELQLWNQGAHRLPFSSMHDYLLKHPSIAVIQSRATTGLDIINAEFSTLSRAVHASAKGFRMTPDAKTMVLWSSDNISLGSWLTRESHVITGVNLLLLCMFREKLTGTRGANLRKAVSLAIPASKFASIKTELGVTLLK